LYEKIHGFGLSSYMDLRQVFTQEFLSSTRFVTPAEISKAYMEAASTPDGLDQFLFNDLKLTLMDNDLPKVNRMTELAGVRVRFPFLDHPLVEFTGNIPPLQKIKGERLRYIFKEAMRPLLPVEIIEKTKHGFGIPVVNWMLRPGKLNDFLKEVVFDSRVETRGIFRKGFVQELYRRSQDDKTPYFGTYLYYILFLELWMREHVDG
jgi:asparagine synthase (glutamine-hydrolysing)